MRQNQLNRALRLVKRNGDKFLIMDKDSDDVFALMSLDRYEDMSMDLDEFYDDDLDGENFSDFYRDKKDWDDDPFAPVSEKLDLSDPFYGMPETQDLDIDDVSDFGKELEGEEKDFNISEEEYNENVETEKKEEEEIKTIPIKNTGDWSSVGNVIAEEALDDVPEDENDDKFYLEPVG